MDGKNQKLTFPALMLLVGVVLTGAGMAVRGDWLGTDAAEAVEERVNDRIDRAEERTKEMFDMVLTQLEEIRDKLD